MQSFTSLLLTIIFVSFILFLFPLDTSNHLLLHLLNTAQPGESRAHASGESASESASEESASGELASGELQPEVSASKVVLERKKGNFFSRVKKLGRKFHRA